jgi:riboflavin kinase/FMN adenylyltransferase
MRVFRHYQNLPSDIRGAVVAIGNFDGVHLGHRDVIEEAGRIARAHDVPWAVLTLEPHPRSVFHPEQPPFRLSPPPAKERLVRMVGPDALFVIPFDLTFAKLSARAFVEHVLVQGLGARHVVCGHDFAFGHGRKGTPELLLWLADELQFGFTCVQEVCSEDGEPYSSTRIRDLLTRADPVAAARLLGRPFEIEGEVVGGERRGRELGYPTANVRLGDYLRPAFGIYAVQASISPDDDGEWLDGVANLGVRPTFDGTEVLLEVHLFDFAGDLYGRSLRTRFIHFLRPEKRFDGLAPLQAQMAEDCREARDRLAAHRPPLPRRESA